jgi:hypothetical protein
MAMRSPQNWFLSGMTTAAPAPTACANASLGIFVAQHDGRRPEFYLGMTDAATGGGQAEHFLRPEGACVKLDRLCGAVHAQIGIYLLDVAHDWPPLKGGAIHSAEPEHCDLEDSLPGA